MPGITGIIGTGTGQANGIALDAMIKRMMHEPFYSSGRYVNEQLGFWIGCVSHKGSFSDCSPVWNEKKDICLLFSGESFADSGEIESLKSRGHDVASANASYLVHLYEELGIKFLEQLNGWFSGALVDLRKNELVLFNDRYGLGRIYYSETPEGFFFSSEAKSLLAVLPHARRLEMQSVAELHSCGCVLQNKTLFSGVSLLPAGSNWTFSAGKPVEKQAYFKKEMWEQQPHLDEESFYRKLKDTFGRILPKYFNGQRGIGMSLTGGLDGRMIMAWAGCAPGSLPCYTFGSAYRDCVDLRVARKVAHSCNQPHQVIPVDGTFLDKFPTLAEEAVYLSDGAMNVTGAAELYVNRIARQIAPVRMTGNYGSEILRGSVALRLNSGDSEFFAPDFQKLTAAAAQTYALERAGNKLSFIAFKQVPWYHYSRLAVEQSQITLRSPYLDKDLVALSFQAPPAAESAKASLRLVAERNPSLSQIPTDRGLVYRSVPVLTRARNLYDEFMFRAEYAYDNGMPQWLARLDHTFAPLRLERLFLGRHKFQHYRIWYRDQLARYVQDVLLDKRTLQRPYLCKAAVEKMVKGHVGGNRNSTSEIHKALTLELIQRQLIERTWN